MGDQRKRFILLHDHVGQAVERSVFSLGLSTKSTPIQILRGELLEALPEAEPPQDSTNIALVGIDRKSLRLECTMECLTRLSDEDANLLLGISSLEERYQTFMDRFHLDFGRKIVSGCKVYVSIKGISRKLPGIVWYKGELPSNTGIMFGVELIDNPGQGTNDGTFRNKRYFTCPQDSGVFIGLDKIMPREDPESRPPPKTNIARLKDTLMTPFLKGKNEQKSLQERKDIKKDQRVVAFLDDNHTVRGYVRYIGEHKDRSGNLLTLVGLQLDTMDGHGTGKLHGKQLFACRKNFALFRPIESVIPEKDFVDGNPKNSMDGMTLEKLKIQEQIRKDEMLARSMSHSGDTTEDVSRAFPAPVNLQRQLREMEQQLRRKHEQEENLQEQLREMEQQMRGKHEQEENLQSQLREMEQQLREKGKQEEILQRQLREMEQQLREKHEQEENLQRRLREMEKQMREKDEQEENFQRQLSEMEQQVREKDEQDENFQRQLREMEQQLSEKDEQEENLQSQLREMEQQLTNLQDQYREKEDETVNLQEQVNELEITLSTARQALSEQVTPDWVISCDEIQLTGKLLGKGGWGSVVEGKYCGCAVAVKQIHELILSPHNRNLFEREMDIASRCRHPCLLQFIGATNDEGSPLFVTELMESSLRALLGQRPLPTTEVSIISLDVARALNYLHQKKPSPIIHRDISSANVLLWRQGNQWRGKVSDYGTANFMQHTMTVGPGAMIYMAPEALTPNQTVKVDVYSFGVLLCEMCIRELPDPGKRDQQIAMVPNRLFRALIRRCLQSEPAVRPNMEELIEELEKPV